MTKKRRKTPNFISLFFLSFLLNFNFACKSDSTPPTGVLSQQVMTSILIETHLAEAYIIESRFRSEDSARAVFKKMEKDIFKKYDTDSSRYARSYQYYALNIEKLDKIYARVVDSLSQKEELLKEAKEKEKEAVRKERKEKKNNKDSKKTPSSEKNKQASKNVEKQL